MSDIESSRVVSAVLDDLERAAAIERPLSSASPAAVAAAADAEESVSIGEIIARMGGRSFAPLLLIPALVMVSPVSTIPGTPTLSALLIGLIAAQMLAGREALWLPRFLGARRIPRARLERAVAFLRRPVARVESLMRPRLTFLADRPGSILALFTCLGITILMPFMEFLPIMASVAALAISLIAAGLLARDGLLVLAGYAVVGAGILIARGVLLGAQNL